MSYREQSVLVYDWVCEDYDGEEKEKRVYLFFKKKYRTECSKQEYCANANTYNIGYSSYPNCCGLIQKCLTAKQYNKHLRRGNWRDSK